MARRCEAWRIVLAGFSDKHSSLQRAGNQLEYGKRNMKISQVSNNLASWESKYNKESVLGNGCECDLNTHVSIAFSTVS